MRNVHSHTRRVFFLRALFPIVALAALVAVIAWPIIGEMRAAIARAKNTGLRLSAEEVALTMPATGAPQIAVTKPSFDGLSQNGQPFHVTADRVVQGVAMDTPMTLDKPTATMTLDTGTDRTATVNATSGVYDPKAQTLQLTGAVTIQHSDGYSLQLQDFHVDLQTGSGQTMSPVTGFGPDQTSLSGQELELRDNGRHIILRGPSKITFGVEPKS
jgi:lipopolysaccharide export system protein LptC